MVWLYMCAFTLLEGPEKRCTFSDYLRNRSALAVNCCVIIHCLEVSCKEDLRARDLSSDN